MYNFTLCWLCSFLCCTLDFIQRNKAKALKDLKPVLGWSFIAFLSLKPSFSLNIWKLQKSNLYTSKLDHLNRQHGRKIDSTHLKPFYLIVSSLFSVLSPSLSLPPNWRIASSTWQHCKLSGSSLQQSDVTHIQPIVSVGCR